jgi:hypothetical protein
MIERNAKRVATDHAGRTDDNQSLHVPGDGYDSGYASTESSCRLNSTGRHIGPRNATLM